VTTRDGFLNGEMVPLLGHYVKIHEFGEYSPPLFGP
jgi:hypothetical protein